MRRLRPIIGVVALCAPFTSACSGEGGMLEGSLTELVDLHYRTAEVSRTDDEVSVRFLQSRGAGEDVALRVTASLLGTSVDANEALDLSENDPAGAQRGRVSRSVEGDPLTSFPPLQRGSLLFHGSITPGSGAYVTGELQVTFERGTELASGRTVFGSFEAKVP